MNSGLKVHSLAWSDPLRPKIGHISERTLLCCVCPGLTVGAALATHAVEGDAASNDAAHVGLTEALLPGSMSPNIMDPIVLSWFHIGFSVREVREKLSAGTRTGAVAFHTCAGVET